MDLDAIPNWLDSKAFDVFRGLACIGGAETEFGPGQHCPLPVEWVNVNHGGVSLCGRHVVASLTGVLSEWEKHHGQSV